MDYLQFSSLGLKRGGNIMKPYMILTENSRNLFSQVLKN